MGSFGYVSPIRSFVPFNRRFVVRSYKQDLSLVQQLTPLHRLLWFLLRPVRPQLLKQVARSTSIAHTLIPRILCELQTQGALHSIVVRKAPTYEDPKHRAPHDRRLVLAHALWEFNDGSEGVVYSVLDLRHMWEVARLDRLQE